MPTLPTRPFGRTGESLPALGLGGGFVGFAGFDRSVETVRHALGLGVRYFDTSVMYRSGASQAILGEALAAPAAPHYLATKIGYFREARHFRSVEAMHVQLRENLRLLRRDSVDLLQVHEADWDNWWSDRSDVRPGRLLDPEASLNFAHAPVIQFLREAKARGLCRHIGVTGNHARHLGRVLQEVDGLDAVLVAYNYTPLNVTAREHILPVATAKGLAVIVAGLFTFVHTLPEGWATEGSYLGPRSDAQLAALQKLQRESGLPMAELALRFVAADERLSTVLAGACQPAEVDQNVASFRRGPLPADLHAAVEAIARQF
ncbi:Pyridoxal 4-dehydrogenase [Lacunisphaera limnophila]|uniref:Pyridoxal 4-dehydrogenase n=1 Tax=Lacunisphaera limnophila TaxID=1838286 RepID=A0A1D8AWP0_9BACT|nr:aldo/keto reductase [Lacunisphaera limnophila]AOS45305.1 Pyridoxal 4-dehydrogenase [Lacunisphaera limnophila]